MMGRNGWWAALAIAGVLMSGCEPPGKPKPEESPQEITDFQVLFSENCAGCHGMNGKNGPGRILNDPLYLALIPRETLKDVIVHGRPGTAMPAWAKSQGGPLTDKQVDALVDGIEKNWAKPVNFHGVDKLAYAGSQQGDAKLGQRLFFGNCYMCHGPTAKVGPVTDAAYLQLVSDQMLRTSILVGRPDLGMPDYRHLKNGKALTETDVTNLVTYLSSKRPAQAAAQGVSAQLGTGQSGEAGATSRGNEGSGNGPGSPRKEDREGNKTRGSSQQGIK